MVSRTCTVNVLAPSAVAVPAITPAVSSISPEGSAPSMTDHVSGLCSPPMTSTAPR